VGDIVNDGAGLCACVRVCEAELSLTGEEFVDLAEHLGPSNDMPSLLGGDIHLGVDAGTSSSCLCCCDVLAFDSLYHY
jgi:hypothetical protein